MKKCLLICSLFLLAPFFILAQDSTLYSVIPNANAAVAGNGVFTGPIGNSARTYQLLINSSELTSFVGKYISGLAFRLNQFASANWPASETVYSNYDVYLSGSVAPADRSLTFIQNVVGNQVQVRSGILTIPIGAFTFGQTPVNAFGSEITFDSPYLYSSGHLLIEIRQNGSNGTSQAVEAITTSGPGYGSLVSAVWTGSYTGGTGTGTQGNFAITQLTALTSVPVELASFTAAANGSSVVLNWTTATETNNRGFYIERKNADGWENIGFIAGNGTTTEKRNYTFTDNNVKSTSYTYRLKQTDYDGTTTYSKEVEVNGISAIAFKLENCWPNPANPSTMISYSIPVEGNVSLVLYNSMGEQVKDLLNQKQSAGVYNLNINGSGLSSGVYFYTIKVASSDNQHFTDTKKLILLK